jgi:hypothetical protein
MVGEMAASRLPRAPRAARAALALAALLAAAAAPAARAAAYVVEKSSLRVRAEGFEAEYEAAIGDFGVPNYGALLVGAVGYAPASPEGCSELVALPPGADFLLVDRGSCFFVEKAWHAQAAGARAVIVADNVAEQLVTMAVR